MRFKKYILEEKQRTTEMAKWRGYLPSFPSIFGPRIFAEHSLFISLTLKSQFLPLNSYISQNAHVY